MYAPRTLRGDTLKSRLGHSFYLKHVTDDEIGVLWDGEPVILQDLRGDPVTVDVSADAVSPLDAEIVAMRIDSP